MNFGQINKLIHQGHDTQKEYLEKTIELSKQLNSMSDHLQQIIGQHNDAPELKNFCRNKITQLQQVRHQITLLGENHLAHGNIVVQMEHIKTDFLNTWHNTSIAIDSAWPLIDLGLADYSSDKIDLFTNYVDTISNMSATLLSQLDELAEVTSKTTLYLDQLNLSVAELLQDYRRKALTATTTQ